MDPTTDEAKKLGVEAANWVVGDDGTGIIKGRMKFCRPVFRYANKASPKEAKSIFIKHKTDFHPIARKLIEKVSARESLLHMVTKKIS